MNKNGGTAFPLVCQDVSKYQVVEGGMTLHQWFAGQVLAGMDHAAVAKACTNDFSEIPVFTVQVCIGIADAMIAEYEKRDTKS